MIFHLAHSPPSHPQVGSNKEWPPLSASQQSEMDGAIVMLQEAVDQVSREWYYSS